MRALPAMPRTTQSTIVALYKDDPWLQSGASSPLSEESLDVLFKYGPIVYSKRCFDSEEYNASVRKVMARYPKISRALAEQEINLFLDDANKYLAQQTDKRKREGPKEDELQPPVGVIDRFLVVAWVGIFAIAARVLAGLSMTTPRPPSPQELMEVPATEALLNLPADSLQQLMP